MVIVMVVVVVMVVDMIMIKVEFNLKVKVRIRVGPAWQNCAQFRGKERYMRAYEPAGISAWGSAGCKRCSEACSPVCSVLPIRDGASSGTACNSRQPEAVSLFILMYHGVCI